MYKKPKFYKCPECGSGNLSAEVTAKAYTDFRLDRDGEWKSDTPSERFDDWERSLHTCLDCQHSWFGYDDPTSEDSSKLEDLFLGNGEDSLFSCPHCGNDELTYEVITGGNFLQNMLLQNWSCSECGCKGTHFYIYDITLFEEPKANEDSKRKKADRGQ